MLRLKSFVMTTFMLVINLKAKNKRKLMNSIIDIEI